MTAPATPLPSAPKPRRRWLTLLLAALIFVAGLISGSGLTMVVAVHRLQYAIHHPEEAPNRIATMLQRRLRLDNEQKAKVESIVAAHQVELMAIRRQFQPKVVDQIDQIRKEIGAVLNDSQREHWTTMFDDLRDRWLPPNPPAEKPQADVKPSA
jgi:predicted Co/Zn/Cd cation transporter (cation efflux family)